MLSLGQSQIIILNGKNVSIGNATKGREAVLPLLVCVLQLHNIFNLMFLISTLEIFFRNGKWASRFFSSTCFFLYAHQNATDS